MLWLVNKKIYIPFPLAIIDKSGITQDFPHSCTYVNSYEVQNSCEYDDSNIVGARNINKEIKINVKTTFVNKFSVSNTVNVRNEVKYTRWM